MRFPITGYSVDKNSLPEVFGDAQKMWVLASSDDPQRILLCTPGHPSSRQSTDALRETELKPCDCFFRICMVKVEGSSEIVIGQGGEFSTAWQLPDGSYVVGEEP